MAEDPVKSSDVNGWWVKEFGQIVYSFRESYKNMIDEAINALNCLFDKGSRRRSVLLKRRS